MATSMEPTVGRFSVELDLTNDADLVKAEEGTIAPGEVRRATVRGVVDSGAALLVIPESVVRQLGLKASKRTQVRYADGRTAERDVVDRLRLTYAGRNAVFQAIVEPARETALIGAIVLEALDLIVDWRHGSLLPRDPQTTIYEIE